MLIKLMDSDWFAAIYLGILVFMIMLGGLVSKKAGLTGATEWKTPTLVNVIIGFFSLLLAFTLSSSSQSSKARISALQQHRGAVASLYRQSFLFDDSLRRSVKEYAVNVIDIKLAALTVNTAEATQELYRKSFMLNTRYLRSVISVMKDSSRTHAGAKTISEELNKIIDLDGLVHDRNLERTPAIVMMLLLIGSWTIGFLMGTMFVFFESRYYLGPIIFLILTSLTVMIIQDMDNPHRGLVKPPYEIYKVLLKEINDDESPANN